MPGHFSVSGSFSSEHVTSFHIWQRSLPPFQVTRQFSFTWWTAFCLPNIEVTTAAFPVNSLPPYQSRDTFPLVMLNSFPPSRYCCVLFTLLLLWYLHHMSLYRLSFPLHLPSTFSLLHLSILVLLLSTELCTYTQVNAYRLCNVRCTVKHATRCLAVLSKQDLTKQRQVQTCWDNAAMFVQGSNTTEGSATFSRNLEIVSHVYKDTYELS